MSDIYDPAWLLGPQGPIARKLDHYEVRPQQIEMAQAVAGAFDKSQHLVVGAGTGVGKALYIWPRR